ncbi:MAG: chemotaxis protein CheA [Alkalispirochaetaceae bacterium]
MLDDFKQSFRDEAFELLNSLEESLLELENNPDNPDEISAVFRAMHTIKGSAAMFGFEEISGFAHNVENVLDEVRDGTLPVDAELISLTLEARDHIRAALSSEGEEIESGTAILRGFEEFRKRHTASTSRHAFEDEPPTSGIGEEESDEGSRGIQLVEEDREAEHPFPRIYRIVFHPHEDIYFSGTNPLLLLEELAGLGEYTAVPRISEIPRLDKLDPEKSVISWEIFLTSRCSVNDIYDVFIFVDDRADISVEVVDELEPEGEEQEAKRLGEILVERGAADRETIERAISLQKRIGEVLVEQGVSRDEVTTALKEQEHIRTTRERTNHELSSSSIRVASEKLDNQIDLVGELVTLQARLAQSLETRGDAELQTISEQLERLVSELRDSTMSIRMLPIGTTFSKFRRLVRDLSQDLGKEVEIEMEGSETELDKTVIDRLGDPLVHIIRNSIDHGIEAPGVREKAGKPRAGTVKLVAEHVGATVQISVRDDGAGLDREAILSKARERGIIGGTVGELTDEQVYDLIMAAGFSTATNVTQVSGRGVGMDVVRREIESLGGTVKISSLPGAGTEMTLSLPLTLAIIDGLLVVIGDEHFVFPLSSVGECIELGSSEGSHRSTTISYRGSLLPVISLRGLFRTTGEAPELVQVVVCEVAEKRVGFVVDEVVGDYQTVIKNLGKLYRNVQGVSGATILGDGTVALILDVPRLAQLVDGAVEVEQA